MDWSPDGTRLLTAGDEGTAKIWEVTSRGAREQLSLSAQETAAGFYAAAFSSDGERVLTSDAGITATEVWDVGLGGDAEWRNLPAPHGSNAYWAGDVRFLPGRRLASTGVDGAIAIRDLRTGRIVRSIPVGDALISSFDVTADGDAIAAALDNGFAVAWDLTTGEELFRFRHNEPVVDVDWSPDGEHLVTATNSGWIRILRTTVPPRQSAWEPTGHLVGALRERGDEPSGGQTVVTPAQRGDIAVTSARFSPDGRFVVASVESASAGSLETIWDWARHRVATSIRATDGSNAARVSVFDPSGLRIATSGGLAGIPGIWDAATGRRVVALPAHSGSPWDIAFTQDGSLIATAGADGTVRLFDATTGGQLLALKGHQQIVARLAFSQDGSMLASKSLDGTVRVWALDLDDLLEIARHQVRRTLTDGECRQYLHLDACPASRGARSRRT